MSRKVSDFLAHKNVLDCGTGHSSVPDSPKHKLHIPNQGRFFKVQACVVGCQTGVPPEHSVMYAPRHDSPQLASSSVAYRNFGPTTVQLHPKSTMKAVYIFPISSTSCAKLF